MVTPRSQLVEVATTTGKAYWVETHHGLTPRIDNTEQFLLLRCFHQDGRQHCHREPGRFEPAPTILHPGNICEIAPIGGRLAKGWRERAETHHDRIINEWLKAQGLTA